jgi:SWI/SNF-related matrix-associated actin-dependent regulator of chromatin subfamily D
MFRSSKWPCLPRAEDQVRTTAQLLSSPRPPCPPSTTMISRSDVAFAYRKGPVAPPQHAAAQQYNNANMQAQQRAEAERRDKMRRTAKNPTDKNIPEGVEDVCIGDGVARYKELREVERTLDATMMRKKLDVMDSKHHSRASRYGTMRIWISNTVDNQPWQSSGIDADAFDFESNSTASYRVKIQGRLLDDQGDEGLEDDEDAMDEDGADALAVSTKPKPFSTYFSAITIDFDRAKSLQPDNFTQIEWKRPEPPTGKESTFSELEFERKSDENINITINLQRHQSPEVRQCGASLAQGLCANESANNCGRSSDSANRSRSCWTPTKRIVRVC